MGDNSMEESVTPNMIGDNREDTEVSEAFLSPKFSKKPPSRAATTSKLPVSSDRNGHSSSSFRTLNGTPKRMRPLSARKDPQTEIDDDANKQSLTEYVTDKRNN